MTSFRVLQLIPDYIDGNKLRAVNALLKEFSPQAKLLTIGELRRMAESNRFYVALNEEESIIGMATLIIYRKPTGRVGMVEDVAVAESYRGKGIGRHLMTTLIATAKSEKLKSIALTSNPKRVAARALYQSLGFYIKDTSCFVLTL